MGDVEGSERLHPVGFSTEQIETIRRAAKAIPHPGCRSRFLEAVIGELIPVEIIVDEDVHRVTAQVLGRIGLEAA